MQTIIPTAFAIGSGVGDVGAAVCPFDLISLALHQLDELLLVDRVLHALVDLDGQGDLPAFAAHGGMVLGLLDAGGLMLLWLADGQVVPQTDLVRESSELRQILFHKMEFLSGFKADRVDDEVRMDVRGIGVSGNDELVVLPLLCHFQSNCVRFLGRDVFLRVEGLHEVEIHFAVAFTVLQLRTDELCAAGFRLAVDRGDQMPPLVFGFVFLHHILQHGGNTTAGLSLGAVDGRDGRHGSHLPLQNFFEQFLDLQIERVGITDVDGDDPAHVRQCGQLIEIGPLLLQRTGEIIKAVNVYDLFSDGAGGEILCEIHSRGRSFPPDGLSVLLRHIKGQRNGFCSVGFFLQYGTSVIKSGYGLLPETRDAEGSSRLPTAGVNSQRRCSLSAEAETRRSFGPYFCMGTIRYSRLATSWPKTALNGGSFLGGCLLAMLGNLSQIAARCLNRVASAAFSGTGNIDTIGTTQLDEPLSVASSDRGGNADFA